MGCGLFVFTSNSRMAGLPAAAGASSGVRRTAW